MLHSRSIGSTRFTLLLLLMTKTRGMVAKRRTKCTKQLCLDMHACNFWIIDVSSRTKIKQQCTRKEVIDTSVW